MNHQDVHLYQIPQTPFISLVKIHTPYHSSIKRAKLMSKSLVNYGEGIFFLTPKNTELYKQ